MSSEFPSALMDVLESRGVMGDMRAKMRSEVFHALDDEVSAHLWVHIATQLQGNKLYVPGKL